MSALTETTIRAALLDCYDRELPCNIVDLGLVLEIILRDDPDAPGAGIPGVPPSTIVTIAVITTHPDPDLASHLRAQIANRISGLEGVSEVVVEIRTDRTWNPGHISARGRRALGIAGNPGLVQISSR